MREPNALVSTEALARDLSRDDLRVFDCTTYLEPPPPENDDPYIAVPGRSSFETAHIPGADFLDLQGEFSDNMTRLRFMMPPREQLETAFGRHGIGEGARVVLYSIGTMMWATRFWWMLKALGFDGTAVLDGKCCTGVRYSFAGEIREARAGGAVVVSAGAFNSPQLLELSGIGQPERLRKLGIEVRHELPGVGENLRDHYVPRTRWLVGRKGVTFNDRGRGLGLAHQVLRYALFRQGMLAMTRAPIRAFVCLREGLEAPDLMLGWIPMLTEPSPKGPRISRQSGLTLYAHPMRPESKGHVHIAAADAHRPPAINFNFLSTPPDAELTVRAVRIARKIMTAPAMSSFQMREVAPGANRTTDDEILDWVKQAAETTYHPVGTCKMGSDPMAVVDAQLRVHGIAGLRVADASIMPTLTSGNTNAPSIVIGEKAADMVLNAAT